MNQIISNIPLDSDAFRGAVRGMKTAIEVEVRKGGGSITFAPLAKLQGFTGGVLNFGHGGVNNWFYAKLTAVACAAMCELVADKSIVIVQGNEDDYKDDPSCPQYPVTMGFKPSRRPLWMPVRIKAYEQVSPFDLSVGDNITVSDQELGRCLHYEATNPLVQEAVDRLNFASRSAFFEAKAEELGTPDAYDLYYTIGSALVEVMTYEGFAARLESIRSHHPDLLTIEEIAGFNDDPALSDNEIPFVQIAEVDYDDFSVWDYRVMSKGGQPLAIRRLKTKRVHIESMVADVIAGLETDNIVKRNTKD